MEEALNFDVGNGSNRFINEIAELNKKLKLLPGKLERLICLCSELSGGKLYVDYLKLQIEEEEKIHEYEKEYPSGPEYPLQPEPKPIGNKPDEGLSCADEKDKSESGKSAPVNVFCKSMPLSIPQKHFKIFAEKNSKNGKPFLTVEQLAAFIERAFCGITVTPVQKFNQAIGEKLFIQSVFYDFYVSCSFEYFNTMKCRDNFIRLLSENFEGWNFRNVKGNFNPKNIYNH